MTRTRMTVATALLATIVTTASHGTDIARPTPYNKAPAYHPAYVAPFTWQGFYMGFNGGYGFGDSTLSAGGLSNTVHPDGGLAGAGFGYNFQAGNIVFGLEGDNDYSWMKDTNGVTAPCPTCSVRNYYIATARGRLGYSWDRWLAYITGGAAFGDISVSTPFGTTQIADKVGWTVGGGIEYALPATHWSTKVEYLYTDFGSMTCDAAHCGIPTDVDLKTNVVRVGVNYRF